MRSMTDKIKAFLLLIADPCDAFLSVLVPEANAKRCNRSSKARYED